MAPRPRSEQLLVGQGDRRHLRRRRASARPRRRPPWRRWRRCTSAAGCSCSPSTRPGGWPTRSGWKRSATWRRRVTPNAFAAAGLKPRGELWVAMLDTKASWDDLVRRHAPDAATRDAILANPLYDNITARFVQSHDYIAMERLHEIHASGRYDLIVVDTPPSRNALDFLDAPERMAEFFGGRLLRWLTVPYRSRVVSVASQPFLTRRRPHPRRAVPPGHRRVLHPLPVDGEGLRRPGRRRCSALLATAAPRSASSRRSRPRPPGEAAFFVAELRRRGLPAGRGGGQQGCCPAWLRDDEPERGGGPVLRRAGPAGRPLARRWWVATEGPRPPGAGARWARASPTSPSWPQREAEQRAELAHRRRRPRGGARARRRRPRSRRPASDWARGSGAEPRQHSADCFARGHPRRARPAAHRARPRDDVAPAAPDRRVGDAGRLLLRRPVLLYVPDQGRAVARARPGAPGHRRRRSTSSDWVGSWANETERPLLSEALGSGEMVEGEIVVEGIPDAARLLAIPVRHQGRVIAVLTREWSPRIGRQPGELERTYLSIFHRFAAMIAAGGFPFEARRSSGDQCRPRVGDGVMVLDADARVQYASPNAVSALHRVGISANAVGLRLAELGFNDALRAAGLRASGAGDRGGRPDDRDHAAHPLHPDPRRWRRHRWACCSLRDVVRAAPARPVAAVEGRHHPRDPPPGEEQPADDLVAPAPAGPPHCRRTRPERSSASRSGGSARSPSSTRRCRGRPATTSPFVEIVRPLLRLAEDALQSPERPVRFRVEGDGGKLPSAHRHAARRRADRAAAERGRSRLRQPQPAGQRRGAAGARRPSSWR